METAIMPKRDQDQERTGLYETGMTAAERASLAVERSNNNINQKNYIINIIRLLAIFFAAVMGIVMLNTYYWPHIDVLEKQNEIGNARINEIANAVLSKSSNQNESPVNVNVSVSVDGATSSSAVMHAKAEKGTPRTPPQAPPNPRSATHTTAPSEPAKAIPTAPTVRDFSVSSFDACGRGLGETEDEAYRLCTKRISLQTGTIGLPRILSLDINANGNARPRLDGDGVCVNYSCRARVEITTP